MTAATFVLESCVESILVQKIIYSLENTTRIFESVLVVAF